MRQPPVAIVIAQSDREELKKQTFSTLEKTLTDYKLFTRDGMKDGEMKTVNDLIKSIDYDWEYVVRSDDDMWYKPEWLDIMLDIYEEHDDICLLGGARYPTHDILEKRDRVYIMDICPGNHWLLSRHVWEEYGPFYEDKTAIAEDVRFCRAIQEGGGKVACLKDPTLVVHTGLVGTTGRGRSPYVTGYAQALSDVTGAKINI